MRSARKRKSPRVVPIFCKPKVVNVDELAEKYEDFLEARHNQILNIATKLRRNLITQQSERELNQALVERYFEIAKTKREKQIIRSSEMGQVRIVNVKPIKQILKQPKLAPQEEKTASTHIDSLNPRVVLKEHFISKQASRYQKAETEYKREVLEFVYSIPKAVEFSTQPLAHKLAPNKLYLKQDTIQTSTTPTTRANLSNTTPVASIAPMASTKQASSVQARAKQASKEVQTTKSLEAVIEQTEVLTKESSCEVEAPTFSVGELASVKASPAYAKVDELKVEYEANSATIAPTNSVAKIAKIKPQKQRPRISNSVSEGRIANEQLDDLAYEQAKGAKGFYCKSGVVQEGVSLRGDSEHPTQDLYVLKNKDGSVIEGTYSLFRKPLQITKDSVRYSGKRSVSGLDKNDRTSHVELKGLLGIIYGALEEKGLSAVCKSMFENKNVYLKKIEEITKQYLDVHPDAKREQLGYLIVEVDPLTGKLSEPGYNPETGLQYTPRVGELYDILITNGRDISRARINVDPNSIKNTFKHQLLQSSMAYA